MPKARKVLLGVLTAWPMTYVLTAMAFVVGMVITGALPGGRPVDVPSSWVSAVVTAHVGTMLLTLALTVYYAIHVYRSPRVPENRRTIWMVLIIVGSFFAQIFYWYLFVWREPEPLATSPSPGAPTSA